jgi:hypothetical protein
MDSLLVSILINISTLQFELIHTHSLPEFPSASAISFDKGKLYIVGDDANHLLVLDQDCNEVDRLKLFDYPVRRIPKTEKADLESCVLLNIADELHLIAFGSASKANRKKIISLPVHRPNDATIIGNDSFVRRLEENGIKEVNIEGATLVGDLLVFVNRGNNSYKKNYLITTHKNFLMHQNESPLLVNEIVAPSNGDLFNGISEICYVSSKDMLLFTLTTEATTNSFDDGIIGDSYIGWINSASKSPMNTLNGMTNLSDVHRDFKGQKIEGICAEVSGENELIRHLVADNDSDESKVFKVRMKID